MGSSKKPKEDPVTNELNRLTLARLKREESELKQNEAERAQILAQGRQGRSSLLSFGWAGPGAGVSPIRPLAEVRQAERTAAAASRQAVAVKLPSPKVGNVAAWKRIFGVE